jgi:BMFP domain-containing protein YqiC
MTYHVNCDSGEITDPVIAVTVPLNNFVIIPAGCLPTARSRQTNAHHKRARTYRPHHPGACVHFNMAIDAPLDAAGPNRYGCRMFDTKFIDDLARQISANIPAGIKGAQQDLEKNIHTLLQATFARLDLVTREEFDTQTRVLARTREKLEQLEKSIASLEAGQHQD